MDEVRRRCPAILTVTKRAVPVRLKQERENVESENVA
jgi:hypothetical protein